MAKYTLSYTVASLSIYELEMMVTLYFEFGDWLRVQESVVNENSLQKGSLASRKRLFIELKKRLSTLTPEQLTFYKVASSTDIKHLAMLSCFKLYGFIYHFATEVMRKKLLYFDFQILNSEYESFYESKAVKYENLHTVSETTQKKLKQVMFKIFEQAGLIESVKTKYIQKPYLSETLITLIIQDNPTYLRAFLYSDNEINEQIKRVQ